jgi:hypothetical protein
MALNISATWRQPVALALARSGLIYECPEIENVPQTPGVYIFGRRFDKSIEPLYVGRATNLQNRLWQHLEGNVKLMMGLKEAQIGERFFMCCEVNAKKGQNIEKVLEILETALITHLLSEGYELLQTMGTKPPYHTITFAQNPWSKQIAPKSMRVRASE